jgi:hypothetical protein
MIQRIKSALDVFFGRACIERTPVEEELKPISLAYFGLSNKVYVNDTLLLTKICEYPSQEFVSEIEELNRKNNIALRNQQENIIQKYGYTMQKDGVKVE